MTFKNPTKVLKLRNCPLISSLTVNRISTSASLFNLTYVPKCEPVKLKDVELLKNFIVNSESICVITGAGISTESGIPDYRSKGVGLFATSDRRPVVYQDFCRSDKIRRRYWARNYAAWPRFAQFQPNYSHKWLKTMEDNNKVSCIITQNVDNLHKKAGSKNVIELHGTGYSVGCLNCDNKIDRFSLQEILDELNPDLKVNSTIIRPDGDVDLNEQQMNDFKVSPCANCGGILKPDIVFFGDNVPQHIVKQVKLEVEKADSLLVLGSSLTTFSGYRIVLQASEALKPIAIINIGETRADSLAQIRLYNKCSEILKLLNSNS